MTPASFPKLRILALAGLLTVSLAGCAASSPTVDTIQSNGDVIGAGAEKPKVCGTTPSTSKVEELTGFKGLQPKEDKFASWCVYSNDGEDKVLFGIDAGKSLDSLVAGDETDVSKDSLFSYAGGQYSVYRDGKTYYVNVAETSKRAKEDFKALVVNLMAEWGHP